MRLSRLPRGTRTAPGRWPCSHSSASRTSTQSAPSSACAPVGVDLRDLGLRPAQADRGTCSSSDVNGSCRYLHSRMSAPARMRAIVAVVALVAAAVVAGVVYATRQDPAQPKALCKRDRRCRIVAGVSSHVPAGGARRRSQKGPKSAARALEGLANEHPNDPVVQFNEATALLCAGYRRGGDPGVPAGEEGGPRHALRGRRPTTSSTRSTSSTGYPSFQYSGDDPLLIQGQLEQRQFHQHTAERLWPRRRGSTRTTQTRRSPQRSAASTWTT